ncbi:hypothetical protein IEO21_03732 [Rhodonia placenta]|uniref:Uncharacterized protein n=1 Tax=Rhodonia placenta TaxID=104341 RepID=A0A8H7P5F9_9APHY|nr:hypothetical protein IEO21_03732 [Postia placenta]
MSGQPPILTAETGTPASEWAKSTTTAAFVRSGFGQQSAVSTPGGDIPGAYPRDENIGSTAANTQPFGQAAKSAVQSVTDAAAQYIPAAKSMHSYSPSSTAGAGTTTDGAVRASEHDNSHSTSLPSSEIEGAQPREHVGGAGALPGWYSEAGVTKLPDERNSNGQSSVIPNSTNQSAMTQSSTYPASPYPATASPDTSTALTTRTTAVTARTSLPSQEPVGQQPFTHQDGAGSLPGLKREAGVAALPDKFGGPTGTTGATSGATGTHPRDYAAQPALARPGDEAGNESLGLGERRAGKDAVGGVGSLVGGKGEEGVAVLPDEKVAGTADTGVSAHGKGEKLAEMDESEREERYKRMNAQPDAKHEAHGAESKVSYRSASEGDSSASCGVREENGEGKETRMDLLHLNIQPRTYTLGTPNATWHGIGVGANSGYQDGREVDIADALFDVEEGDGYDTDYHPAQLHPIPKDAPAAGTGAAPQEQDVATKGGATKEGNEEGGAGVPAEHHGDKVKKAGFLDKMKGEAKVLMGKMEGKKGVAKVEEGRRVKAGEA